MNLFQWLFGRKRETGAAITQSTATASAYSGAGDSTPGLHDRSFPGTDDQDGTPSADPAPGYSSGSSYYSDSSGDYGDSGGDGGGDGGGGD